jgi:hypothetical protein
MKAYKLGKKSTVHTRLKLNRLLMWVKANRRRQLTVSGIILALLICGVSLTFMLFKSQNAALIETGSMSLQAKKSLSLYVDSNIPGVIMRGSQCISPRLDKLTPFNCELPENKNEATITAPEETIKDGKTYSFQSWDGCSEGNVDWKICKKVLISAKAEKITATYVLRGSSASSADTAPAGQSYASYVPNDMQCKDTTFVNVSNNMATCTVKILSSMRLFMGIGWSPASGTKEPEVSVVCNPSGDRSCTQAAYRDGSLKQNNFLPGTAYVINGEYQMGTDAINSNMYVESLQTSSSQTPSNSWSIMFSINYSFNGQNFIFDSSTGYDNWSGHGTIHDYYVTLNYKKVN